MAAATDEGEILVIAFKKWLVLGEPLSSHDFRRIMEAFRTRPIQIDRVSDDDLARLKTDWLTILQAQIASTQQG